jgi:hypothetical protein
VASRSEAAVPIGAAAWEAAVAAESGLLDAAGNLCLHSHAFEALEAELNREATRSPSVATGG